MIAEAAATPASSTANGVSEGQLFTALRGYASLLEVDYKIEAAIQAFETRRLPSLVASMTTNSASPPDTAKQSAINGAAATTAAVMRDRHAEKDDEAQRNWMEVFIRAHVDQVISQELPSLVARAVEQLQQQQSRRSTSPGRRPPLPPSPPRPPLAPPRDPMAEVDRRLPSSSHAEEKASREEDGMVTPPATTLAPATSTGGGEGEDVGRRQREKIIAAIEDIETQVNCLQRTVNEVSHEYRLSHRRLQGLFAAVDHPRQHGGGGEDDTASVANTKAAPAATPTTALFSRIVELLDNGDAKNVQQTLASILQRLLHFSAATATGQTSDNGGARASVSAHGSLEPPHQQLQVAPYIPLSAAPPSSPPGVEPSAAAEATSMNISAASLNPPCGAETPTSTTLNSCSATNTYHRSGLQGTAVRRYGTAYETNISISQEEQEQRRSASAPAAARGPRSAPPKSSATPSSTSLATRSTTSTTTATAGGDGTLTSSTVEALRKSRSVARYLQRPSPNAAAFAADVRIAAPASPSAAAENCIDGEAAYSASRLSSLAAAEGVTIGIDAANIPPGVLERFTGTRGGVRVQAVVPQLAAWRGGVCRGDVILSMNGVAVQTCAGLKEALRSIPPTQRVVPLELYRYTAQKVLTIYLKL